LIIVVHLFLRNVLVLFVTWRTTDVHNEIRSVYAVFARNAVTARMTWNTTSVCSMFPVWNYWMNFCYIWFLATTLKDNRFQVQRSSWFQFMQTFRSNKLLPSTEWKIKPSKEPQRNSRQTHYGFFLGFRCITTIYCRNYQMNYVLIHMGPVWFALYMNLKQTPYVLKRKGSIHCTKLFTPASYTAWSSLQFQRLYETAFSWLSCIALPLKTISYFAVL
jgi:hypothetical protein